MIHKIFVWGPSLIFDEEFNKHLDEGYVLDPIFKRNPIVVDNVGAIYHLIKYESEDEKPQPEQEEEIVSLKQVDNPEVDGYLAQGYRIHAIYAKHSILVKKK